MMKIEIKLITLKKVNVIHHDTEILANI